MPFTLAIIGRPNVGKSTLFNRLVGKRMALVDDTPGVTRDRRIGEGRLADLSFRVIDTAGLEEAFDDSLEARMRQQTEAALREADVALMLIDARAGVTPLDKHFAQWLRRQGGKVLLLANKCEGRAAEAGLHEAWSLGLGEPIAVSAAHGEGLVDLVDALRPLMPAEDEDTGAFDDGDDAPMPEEEGEGDTVDPERDLARPIRLAIIGRPNVGKSTLMNALLDEERVLTGPEAGITRDAIGVDWTWRGQAIHLVDTAGLRRKARIDKVDDKVEFMSVGDTLETIRLAHVCVLLLDAGAIMDKQDLTIARHVIEEGRALVIAINKWDTVEDHAAALRQLSDKLQTSMPQVRGVPTVTVSALRGQKLDKLMDAVLDIHKVWNRRVRTGPLNRWLPAMLEAHPPPLVRGRRLKIRYITQVKGRPPTFALFVSQAEEFPDSYLRYLVNGLRDSFALAGVPIRMMLRQPKNPYADKG
ncbi:ribosome biogenesis GTPase Der [Mycobacterium sp. KBS0706]|uniref:ribosome biogenesis GTPase Der n=1 Tax=Mycobacterium sp. KBS0706 TaxID=2578109 RepID=UPI00110FA005|nr:ribosome biogenesis GTPase Der [Mycobacterium sp. KBS0706]TSD85340.1 ribosome biogenesis GTPase Der [Mycobacterium sp. KBS0706]